MKMRFAKIIIKIFISLLVFVAGFILFGVAALVFSTGIQHYYDLPLINNGIIPCSIAGGLITTVTMIFFRSGRKKSWKAGPVLFALLLVVCILYNVLHRKEPFYEYIHSSRNKLIETLQKQKAPAPFFFSVDSDSRFVQTVAIDRPRIYSPQRVPGEALEFSAASPDLEGRNIRLQVAAVVNSNVTQQIYETPPLQADKWNHFTIPAEKLNPSMESLLVRLVIKERAKNDFPLVFITDLERVKSFSAPNVIMVMVDTFRPDHLDRETAPFLSALMQKSVVFENTMAPCSWTLPSTASVLTGLYPHQHGHISKTRSKLKDVYMISESFKSADYKTAAISNNMLIEPRYGFAQGFDQFISLGKPRYNHLNSGKILTLRAKELIKTYEGRPFFMYLHYMDPHFPYLAPPPDTFFQLRGGLWEKIKSFYSFLKYDSQVNSEDWLMDRPRFIPLVIARYRGEIRYWDRQLEDLVSYIKSRRMLSNTIIVVVSDHGEAFGEHGNYFHGNSLFQEEVHVPLIIYDGRRPAAARIKTPVSSTEVARIIAGIAGIESSPEWHGRTMKGLLKKDNSNERIAAVFVHQIHKVSFAARKKNQKIIINHNTRTGTKEKLLFNLADDPHERRNLWTYPESEELTLYKWMTEFLPPPDSITYQPEEINRQLEKDLKAMGYVQ